MENKQIGWRRMRETHFDGGISTAVEDLPGFNKLDHRGHCNFNFNCNSLTLFHSL